MQSVQHVCLLGLGEVGSVLAPALLEKGLSLSSYDTAFNDKDSKASRNLAQLPGVAAATSAATAVQDAQLVVSAVTAEQALIAADSVRDHLHPDCWYWDMNSVAPNTKKELAARLNGKARFVEGAIMSPIQPRGIESPVLLGGPHARAFADVINTIGFSGSEFFSEEWGKSAASKMCRSVIIKGIESLLTESLISARYYGVEDQVLQSLNNLLPGVDWQQHSAYMISRSLEHGVRRAEEMREVHKTVKDAGLIGLMSAACADTQAWTADFNQHVEADELLPMLDQFREQL